MRLVIRRAVAVAAAVLIAGCGTSAPSHSPSVGPVPEPMIEQRLGVSPTKSQIDDFERVRDWLARGVGVGLEDVEVENIGTIRDTALTVLGVMGWG